MFPMSPLGDHHHGEPPADLRGADEPQDPPMGGALSLTQQKEERER
jgi:hypothetical protein